MNVTSTQELAKLAKKSNAASAIFDDMANRERFRREYNLKRLHKELSEKSKKPIDDKEFLETFKALQAAGLGSLIVGRGGKEDRFIWDYNLKDVARCAKGEIQPDQIGKLPKMGPSRRKETGYSYVPAQSDDAAMEAGSALDVIIIQPHGAGVERVRINPDKEKMFREFLKILTEK